MKSLFPPLPPFPPFPLLSRRLARLLLLTQPFIAFAAEPTPSVPLDWFQGNPGWTVAKEVTFAEGSPALQATGKGEGTLLLPTGDTPRTRPLRARVNMGDCTLRMEFLLGPKTQAGMYLEGRYRIQLSDEAMGAVGPLDLVPESAATRVAPLVNAAGNPGAWQTLEAKFRAPRFDEAHNKTQDALLLEVKVNGKVVQFNTVQATLSKGSEFDWEESWGQATLVVNQGSVALREFSLRRADFSVVKVPAVSGQPTNTATLVDLVKQGEENFRGFGCIECHATQDNDPSVKTGPNLFGLFTTEPRERAIISGAEGQRFMVKADRGYLERSIRAPLAELAIAENGPTEGKPYLPAMPPFVPGVLTDAQIDAIGAYLATLNYLVKQGPVIRLAEISGVENYNPMTDRLQMLVDRTVRIQRGPMQRVSARSIHVGQPNSINYTFDPRVLGIVQIWQGGFLDMSGEFLNRGGNGLKQGYDSHAIDLGASAMLLAPLNANGKLVDFSFKDALFNDGETIRKALYSPRDHLDTLAEIDAQFLGYSRDSTDPNAAPVFNYRIGKNLINIRTEFAANGEVTIVVGGDFAQPQGFLVNDQALKTFSVSEGKVNAGSWLIPAGSHKNVVGKGRLTLAEKAWHAAPSTFEYRRQPLVVESSHPTLPSGYRAETYQGPKDNYGRALLFEALGLAVAPDGTLVVATRTAGIWRLVDGQWQLFAEGLFDSLGVQVEDEHGLTVVAGQKAELTRISDTNGDGLADRYETLTDAFTYHGNYHSYMHGPIRDAHGDYFITLNLDDAGRLDYEYRANGKFMGTGGGFRGWAIRVPAKGGFEPWANGLRSPAGLGFAPDGRFWYADNQGEYVGTSKLFVMKKDAFYGHPASLVDLPGMTPDSPEIAGDNWWNKRERAVILFPQRRLANSPGNPLWDTTKGKFGPFAGQIFIGDQTQSLLMRVATESVDGIEQGVVIPFATDLESGIMRPVLLPDNSMLLGQTGRGWQAKGGHVASLQHLIWDGKTIPPTIHHVSAITGGFTIYFTVPIPAEVKEVDLAHAAKVASWVYRDAADYGSPELDDHDEEISRVEMSADRSSLRVILANTAQPKLHPQQTARVYHLTVLGKDIWKDAGPGLDAFYTLYQFPTAGK